MIRRTFVEMAKGTTMVLIITMRVFVLMNDPPNKRILFFKLKKSS